MSHFKSITVRPGNQKMCRSNIDFKDRENDQDQQMFNQEKEDQTNLSNRSYSRRPSNALWSCSASSEGEGTAAGTLRLAIITLSLSLCSFFSLSVKQKQAMKSSSFFSPFIGKKKKEKSKSLSVKKKKKANLNNYFTLYFMQFRLGSIKTVSHRFLHHPICPRATCS